MVNPDGSAITIQNKVIITLVNFNLDSGDDKNANIGRMPNQKSSYLINCDFLASAYFNDLNYALSLKYLEALMLFFAEKPVFRNDEIANTGDKVRDIRVKMETLTDAILTSLWARLGVNYMPCNFYTLTFLIDIPDDQPVLPITELLKKLIKKHI